MMRLIAISLTVAMAVAACGRDVREQAGGATTEGRDSVAQIGATGLASASDASGATDASGLPGRAEWTVTPAGAGPVRIGMTASQARAALRLAADTVASEQCYYLPGDNSPLSFMILKDTVVRVDVRDSLTASAEGARVGDPESRILELYRGKVTRQPHKYTDGEYLIVVPGVDTLARLVFETEERRVSEYRAGRMPMVGWVEGCS